MSQVLFKEWQDALNLFFRINNGNDYRKIDSLRNTDEKPPFPSADTASVALEAAEHRAASKFEFSLPFSSMTL